MNVCGTQMHVVTFVIAVFELAMLFFQVIYFLERISDRKRLSYLILLVLLILYNVCSGLFPDPNIAIPIKVQVVIAYLVGFTMSMYVVYYFYSIFELSDLRFFATYGVFLFLLLPFIACFLVPYLFTGNLELSRQATVIIPFLYGIGFIFYTTKALRAKYKRALKTGIPDGMAGHALSVYISMICWAMLPVIVFFGDFQLIEHIITNAGFLFMSVIYVRTSIRIARAEYKSLIDSEIILKRKIEAKTIQLRRVNENLKNVFINIAHEVKTPLMLVNNYLQDCDNEGEMEARKNNLRNARQFLGKLTADIINLFDIQSLERGFPIYHQKKVSSFSQILLDKIELFRHQALKNEVIIEGDIENGLLVAADPHAIERITNNILANSIKYSIPNGSVKIRLFSKDNKVIFSAADDGVGIALSHQEKVFEPFYRVGQPSQREGLGLGLAIVKGIVESLRGSVEIKSDATWGTEVLVTLDRYHVSERVDVERHTVNNDLFNLTNVPLEDVLIGDGAPYIMLIDNNVHLAHYLAGKLGTEYNVYVSSSGADALRRLQSIPRLDVIVCDVMVGDKMSGYDFFRSVAGNPSWKHVPFIFTTARTGVDDRLAAFRLGAIHYLEKPFLTNELILKINALIQNVKAQRIAFVEGASRLAVQNDQEATKTAGLESSQLTRYGLTTREQEIVRLITIGQPYKEIAHHLKISDGTVSKHVSNIFAKLSVSNRLELVHKLQTPA